MPDADRLLVDGLRRELRALGRVVVAFSGGADSAFLAWVAHDTLGPDAVLSVTAVSASLATAERGDAASLAEEWGLRWQEVDTGELDNPAYLANAGDRCAHCKSALLDALEPIARQEEATVILGVNVDDLGDHRPGQVAAADRGAVFPLVLAGFTKEDVRRVSHAFGLRTWDKPAAPCLSSRIPYGTPVTLGTLRSIEEAEAALHELGFREVRVRHQGDTARVEVPLADLAALVERRAEVVEAVQAAGYRRVMLDLEGLRSGNLNDALRLGPSGPSAEPTRAGCLGDSPS
jgi:pyridinium-3,5-biscarboxylic acid mononucleotide sulfurtransferase